VKWYGQPLFMRCCISSSCAQPPLRNMKSGSMQSRSQRSSSSCGPSPSRHGGSSGGMDSALLIIACMG